MGQHCLAAAKEAAARGNSRQVILGALLHDATECYLSDVPHPYKVNMPRYRELEDRLLQAVLDRFLGGPLTPEEWAEVEQIDRALRFSDLHHLMDHPENREQEGTLRLPVDYRVRPLPKWNRSIWTGSGTVRKKIKENDHGTGKNQGSWEKRREELCAWRTRSMTGRKWAWKKPNPPPCWKTIWNNRDLPWKKE
mgnify:CR=1 FL=1